METFRDLPGNIRRRELAHLQEVIRSRVTITSELLSEWVSSSPDERGALLGSTVWGVIRWPKALGLPKSPRLADGFSIVHQAKKDDHKDDGTGTFPDGNTNFVTQAAPSVWDSSSESEHRVSFFFFAPPDHFTLHRLIVELAFVPWSIGTLGGRGTLRLTPPGVPDFFSTNRPYVVRDFEVKLDPYHRAFSIRPFGPAAGI